MRRLFFALAAGLVLNAAAGAQEIWQTLPEPPAMPPARESGMAPVNDIRMYYAVYGEGEPVLLIHGGLGHADVWGFQVPALAESHQVIVADSRGHGRSTRSEQPFGYRLMANDYLALLNHLGIDQVALVGWSDGGIIGLDIAIRHPERLSGLFAFAANYTPEGVKASVADDPTFNAYIARAGEDYARLSPTPDEFDDFVGQISQMWATEPNYSKDQLRAISVPTVIFAGEHDEAIESGHTAEMAALIPHAGLVIMKDASHFAMAAARRVQQDRAGVPCGALIPGAGGPGFQPGARRRPGWWRGRRGPCGWRPRGPGTSSTTPRAVPSSRRNQHRAEL